LTRPETLIAIGRRCSSLPDLDTREADEILGYDETGTFRDDFPKTDIVVAKQVETRT